jgi:integrase
LLKLNPNKAVNDFTISDVEKILHRYKNINSQRTYRRAFKTFFYWCVRHHYCLENPCDRLDKLASDMSKIASLSLEECKRLLYAALQLQDGAAAPCVAIGLFAGLRPSEIRDLKPEDILKDKVRVSGGKLRRQLKRSVPIPPVLAEWLKEFPFKNLPIGMEGKMRRLKKATKAKKWVQDIIRHTSITFQTERDKNEALTAYNCGTSIQMMNRHYRDTIDNEKTVAEFWNLTPAKLRAKPPEVTLEIKRRVDWPDKKALRKLVWQKPLIHAAKDIGVSDVALRKHCVKLGIELPRQGHWVRA